MKIKVDITDKLFIENGRDYTLLIVSGEDRVRIRFDELNRLMAGLLKAKAAVLTKLNREQER